MPVSRNGPERRIVLRKKSVRLVGAICAFGLAIASMSWMAASAGYSPPMAARIIGTMLAAALAVLAVRSLRLGVEVRDGELIVRNLLRTRVIRSASVAAVVMPNQTAVQAIPRLRLDDGSELGLLGLSRMKNRAWGRDRATDRLVQELARLCGAIVVGEEGADRFGWG